MVLELNSENYEQEVLKSELLVIVDYWAEWCGPCKMLGPVFEKLSEAAEFKGKLKFAKLDIEKNSERSEKNNVRGIPCLILFSKGNEVDRIVGYSSEETLKAKISEILAKAN